MKRVASPRTRRSPVSLGFKNQVKNSLAVVRDWMTCKESKLIKMTFNLKELMKAFRKRWLQKNWNDMKALMLDSTWTRTKKASELDITSSEIERTVNTARDTLAQLHFSEAQLRTQIEAGLDKDLRVLTMEDKANNTTELLPCFVKLMTLIRNDRTIANIAS